VRVLVRYGLVTLRWLWILWLWVLLILGLLFVLLFAVFYRLSDYQPQIEHWASEILQQPIVIGDISTGWDNGAPTLELQQIRLVSPDQQGFIEIPKARIGLSMLTSLLKRQWITSQIHLNINQLTLHRQLDGSVRVIGFSESETAVNNQQSINTDAQFFLQWLLTQEQIQLHITRVTWQELQRKPLHFDDLNLNLQKKVESNIITGQIVLPINEQPHILQLSTTSQWYQTDLLDLQGKIQLLTPQNTALFSSQIIVNPNQHQGWQIQFPKLHVHTAPETMQNQLDIQITPNGYQHDITAHLAFLDLSNVEPVAKQFLTNNEILTQLNQLEAKGYLKHIQLNYPANQQWTASAKLDRFYFNYQQHYIKNLTGHINLQPEQAKIHISDAEVNFIEPSLYGHGLYFKNLNTEVTLQKQQNATSVQIHQFKVQEQNTPINVTGKVDIPSEKPPFLDLVIKIGKISAEHVYRYLPDKEIANTANWLNKALISGTLLKSELRLKGAADNVFKLEKNLLQFKATAQQIKLNYADDWFPIEKLNATLKIANNQLEITPSQAYLLGSSLKNTMVKIPKLTGNDKKVLITGKMDTTAQKVFTYLYETPLSKKIDLERDKVKITGKVGVNINLKIGLDKQPDQIKGSIQFKNNQLQESFIGHTVNNLKGTLFFTSDKLEANNLKGTLWGKPTTFDFSLLEQQDKLSIQINSQGKMDQQFINQEMSTIKQQWKDLKLYQRFEGETEWQSKVKIINFKHPNKTDYTQVQFLSDLQGMDIHLPAPLNKISPLKQPLSVTMRFPENSYDSITLSLGNLFNGILELDDNLRKGQILIGSRSVAQLPHSQRLDIKGHITHLGVKDWLQFWHNLPDGEGNSPLLPIDIQLRLEQLGLWTQQFKQVKATLTHRDQLWRIFLNSQAVLGQLQYHMDKDSVNAQLKYLNLAFPQKQIVEYQPENLTNPFEFPSVSAHIDQLTFGNKELGNVNLYAKPHAKGWELELFEAKAHGLNIQAQGLWQYDNPQRAHSQFEVKLHSADTGQLLRRLGYPEPPIEQGFTEGLLEIDWAGGFDDFDLSTMQGHLRLLMTQGEIVDVDPGVGRIFGLFDVVILPKRLFLDFRDITDKGLSFDSIVGEFDIKRGIASTKNMILQSPVAYVEMNGYTHFVEEYYDQTVKVTPHVTNALPVAGTLVGGLGVGAVTLIIQKMLQTELEKSLYYEYHVLGDWDDPKIKQLNTQQ